MSLNRIRRLYVNHSSYPPFGFLRINSLLSTLNELKAHEASKHSARALPLDINITFRRPGGERFIIDCNELEVKFTNTFFKVVWYFMKKTIGYQEANIELLGKALLSHLLAVIVLVLAPARRLVVHQIATKRSRKRKRGRMHLQAPCPLQYYLLYQKPPHNLSNLEG